jgi:hypothetical protein
MDKVLNLRSIKPISIGEMTGITYPSQDVFVRDEDKRTRITALDKAVTLGRSAKIKTNLVFNSEQGYRSVSCIVHAIDIKGVTIDGGHFIPMHAIYSTDIR